MSFLQRFFILFLFSLSALAAMGDGSANQAIQATQYPEHSDVELSVPQNQMDLAPLDQSLGKSKNFHLDVSLSTWAPTKYSDSSYLSNATDYKTAGFPQVALALAGGGWDFRQVNLAMKAGFAYSKYTRRGDLGVAGSAVPLAQDMNLYSLFFGAELTTERVWWKHLQAYFDAGVMPTWSQASSTDFSDGNSDSYWAAKESAGLIWNLKAQDGLATEAWDWAAEVGVETTQGLGRAPLSGTGVTAGLRAAL
jgi:hypothetical protein